jgi:hypothetical protein
MADLLEKALPDTADAPNTADGPTWAICVVSVVDASIVAASNIQCTYNTRTSDEQIPCRVFNVHAGGFSVEIQNGTMVHWLSYNPQ